MRGLGELLEQVNAVVPQPVLIGLALVVAILLFPGWLQSVRARQVRGTLRREGEQAALSLAGSDPRRLVPLIEEAIRLGRPPLARQALQTLEANGADAEELRRLRAMLEPPPPPVGHPTEAAIRIRHLLEEGLTERARLYLEQALSRYPDDPELRALAEEVERITDRPLEA